jgi:hypothetical protein
MLKWLLRRRINAFEKEYDCDVGHMRYIMDASLMLNGSCPENAWTIAAREHHQTTTLHDRIFSKITLD